jgi:hypothetical protein
MIANARTGTGVVAMSWANNDPVPAPAAYLIGPDPTGQSDVRLEHLCDLSDEDYQRYKVAERTLHAIVVANVFTYVQGSLKVFETVWKGANSALASNEIRPNTDPQGATLWNTQLRAAALSLCMSLVYHQEQTYQDVCELHGANSRAHQKAKTIFGELYDSYPGYRYLYGLRNVMVHDSMDAIALSAETARNGNGETVAVYDLLIDRSVMVRSPKLNRNLRDEFAALDENPSLLELLPEVAQPLVDANRKLRGTAHPDLTQACNTVIEFDDLFEERPGTRALVHEQSPEMTSGFRFSYTGVPPEVIHFARTYQPSGSADDV